MMDSYQRNVLRGEGLHCRVGWLGLTDGCGRVSSRRSGVRTWRIACGAELIAFSDQGRVEWSLLFEQGQALVITRDQAGCLLRQWSR